MLVKDAKAVARQWVIEEAGNVPGFVGAYFAGSSSWLPDDVVLPPTSDLDLNVVHGKPIVTGTRVLVAQIVGHLAAGDTIEAVCEAYDLTPEQVRAALGYAASRVADEEVYVFAHS